MKYPKRVIKVGERDQAIVKAVRKKLNAELSHEKASPLYLDPASGIFDKPTQQAVMLLQARRVDATGTPLQQDGKIGSLTWAALFGDHSVPSKATVRSEYMTAVLAVAAAEIGVREVPVNSNRGPKVEQYLTSTRTPAGNPWCCAFVYWCFQEAATQARRANPMVQTAGCLDHWRKAPGSGAARVTSAEAIADPGLLTPGVIFIMDHGGGTGHTGLVESIDGGLLTTIEGNTDASKTREGGGVYRLTRKVSSINKGYVRYAGN